MTIRIAIEYFPVMPAEKCSLKVRLKNINQDKVFDPDQDRE